MRGIVQQQVDMMRVTSCWQAEPTQDNVCFHHITQTVDPFNVQLEQPSQGSSNS